MHAPMLLLVDDQADVRFLLGLFLRDAGYALEEATDSEAGLAAARTGAYDLVLLDQQMPPAIRLSPRYMTNGEPPRNSSEIITAWASPRGASCSM